MRRNIWFSFRISGLFIFILLLIIQLSSCIPQKKMKLVQRKLKNDTTELFRLQARPKNTIQPFDNLYIKVMSPDRETSIMFDNDSYNSTTQNVNYNMISYTVNGNGFIDFPYVGLIHLNGLTILEAKDTIQNALSKYISNVNVSVKFVGKSITVIGEVRNQGEYEIYDDNVNILTALAMANGISDYADIKNVTVIREYENSATYNYVDLTDRHLLKSKFYYLKPEDIVIIPPLNQKSYGFASFPYTIVLTSFTTIITLITFFRAF